jgi:DNA-binding transcriptional LysR family regulator
VRPTFVQLETFYWIGRLGSVKEAARHLHVAPPTISLRIDQLEAELGNSTVRAGGAGGDADAARGGLDASGRVRC